MPGSTNPFAAPETECAPPADARAHGYGVIFAWERWRVVYNALLAAAGFTAIATANGPLPEHFEVDIAAAVFGANLCYCLGPVLEAYLVWFGVPQKYARWGLLILGTLFSAAIAFGGTAVYLMNHQ